MNNNLPSIPGIYFGSRDSDFKTVILNVLKKGDFKTYDMFLTDDALKLYADAFTSDSVNPLYNNYQYFEMLGDLSINKFIGWYFYKRFPQLKCAEGVKIVARLRINYGSKQTFSQIAESLNFWPFITAKNDLRQRNKKSLLEDVFESFIGATETIASETKGEGLGYTYVHKILTTIFDSLPISLKYEDLYDAKTRLKELFDRHAETLGPIIYQEEKNALLTTSTVYRVPGVVFEKKADGMINPTKFVLPPNYQRTKIRLGSGSAALKSDAQQKAAANALSNLEKDNIVKITPKIYQKFNGVKEEKTTQEDVLNLLRGNSINDLLSFPTKGKLKYQNKYTCTILHKYCTERDLFGILIALKMGANPNIQDSDELTCLDLLLIGREKPNLITRVVSEMAKHSPKSTNLLVHRNVFQNYGFYPILKEVKLDFL
jgi:dsRNA-specific ribonuclease